MNVNNSRTEAPNTYRPLPNYLRDFMPDAVRGRYEELLERNEVKARVYEAMEDEIVKVSYRGVCQPLHMESVPAFGEEDYKVPDILHKSWRDLLIDWPIENIVTERELERIAEEDRDDYTKYPHIRDRRSIEPVELNEYTKYPYERINDPSHPFSPRHIWEETERERFSDYGVMCSSTPVDLILGTYGKLINGDPKSLDPTKRPLTTYGSREKAFHQCISCRIDINENKEACIADPYSFTTPGGCDMSYRDGGASGAGKCSEFDLGPSAPPAGVATGTPGFIEYLKGLEVQYGLREGLLHTVATIESTCTYNARAGSYTAAGGMFQFILSTWNGYARDNGWSEADRDNPCIAAIAAAKYYAGNAQAGQCQWDAMILGYLCGGSIIDNVLSQGVAAAVNGASGPCRAQADGYLEKGFSISGFSDNNGCSPGGPFPEGNGGGAAGGGIGSGPAIPSGGGGSGTPGGVTDIFGGSQGPGGSTNLGNFDIAGCPDNTAYDPAITNFTQTFSSTGVGNNGPLAGGSISRPDGGNFSSSASAGGTGKTCAAFSFPTPDLPGRGGYGCHGRTFYPPGCGGSCIAHFNGACGSGGPLSRYTGAYKEEVCSAGCPQRIHEGMDIAFEYGIPIYASADGRVSKVSANGYVTIDHTDACVDPSCTKKFTAGVNTRYYHMGPERVIVKAGDQVKRCQQIGTVGDRLTETVPHLHYEAWDPANTMTGSEWGYFALANNQKFFAHPDDKSCGGGIMDLQDTKGICLYALPTNSTGGEDLTPPEYLADYTKANSPAIAQPDPLSKDRTHPGGEKHREGDKFDLEVPGMVYNGVWTECAKITDQDDKTLCEYLDVLGKQNQPAQESEDSGTYINPTPCFDMSDYFSTMHPERNRPHWGIDIADPLGTPIFAASDGVISYIGGDDASEAGNYVEIAHPDGNYTRYLHMRSPGARAGLCSGLQVGTAVVKGQVIGFTGDRAVTNAAHLHFELYTPTSESIGRGGINAAGVGPVDPYQNNVPEQTPNDPQCPAWNALSCGDVANGLPAGLASGKTICLDKPCTLRYDEADTTSQCAFPMEEKGCGPLGHFSQRNEGEDTNGDCCYNITKPVVPLNILKLRPTYDERVHNPKWLPDGKAPEGQDEWIQGGWVNPQVDAEAGGVPEGYSFGGYFSNHRPFMRWWDTGAESAQLLQDQIDASGSDGRFDALVGVGVEKNNCGIGGWGNPDRLDANTSWLELKLYQARTQILGYHCIGRYERIFKRGGAEERVLNEAGATFGTRVGVPGGTGTADISFPIGWRGYASEHVGAYRFPYFVTYPSSTVDQSAHQAIGRGIDLARPGDILIWDENIPSVKNHKRLPHVAFVSTSNTSAMGILNEPPQNEYLTPKRWSIPAPEASQLSASVTVKDYNYGKYPDACGSTNWWNMGAERTLYKNDLPTQVQGTGTNAGISNFSCTNTDLAQCVERDWDDVLVYRPYDHVRR